MDLKALERRIRDLLTSSASDEAVRAELETLAQTEPNLNGFTWLWGPVLYGRNRIAFRPFILAHFATYVVLKHRLQITRWKGEIATALEPWLADVDEANDIELFRRLYTWRLRDTIGWRSAGQRSAIADDLLARFGAAATRAGRDIVLQKFSFWFDLEEKSALALFRHDPTAAGPYILKHLPWSWRANKPVFWRELLAAADQGGDETFRWNLYRVQVPSEVWARDALDLCARERDTDQLLRRLDRQHPRGAGRDLGPGYLQLLAKRGRDVVPYVLRHIGDVRHGWLVAGSFGKVRDFARDREWWDLWAAVIRVAATPKEFNAEIAALLGRPALGDTEVTRRLVPLTGVSREFNFAGFGLASVHQLDETNALALLKRFPNLLRGPFRPHLQIGPWSGSYSRLIDALIAAGDDDLLDHVAARIVTRGSMRWAKTDLLTEANRLADHYAAMKADETRFSRRAASVLGRVPAFTIYSYDKLIRENRLARLLFERSAAAYLADPVSVRDLVEASEIHVMALAYRALGLDDDRARTLAAENLSLLLGTLLRPLQRATRLLAFCALANAAHTREAAVRILAKAREALDLPDKKYPKEQLLGLIATVLARWPELRAATEVPVVYRRRPAA